MTDVVVVDSSLDIVSVSLSALDTVIAVADVMYTVQFDQTLTTKGDIKVFSTEQDRLPVGPDGYLLEPDSTTATGLAYKAKNITNTQATDLTDSGESTLHYHDSDRNMGNAIETATKKVLTVTERDKIGFLSVTQSVDLDAMETNSNASKVVTDWITVTQAVNLDTIEINSDASKVITDWIAVTQAVNLDTMESDVATNNGKVSNVTTDLTYSSAATQGTVVSSDGTDAVIPAASTTIAGLITNTQYDDVVILTSTANTTLHYHDADRARSNHTGTQLAATISDFSNAVGAETVLTGVVDITDIVLRNTDITKIDIASFDYFIQGVKYSYAGGTAISPTIASGDSSTFVGADSTGIIYSSTKFTETDTTTIVPLARLQSEQGQSGPGSDLETPVHTTYSIGQDGHVDRVWFEHCVGALYSSGGTFSENGVTPLQVDQVSGVFHNAQRKHIDITGSSNILAKAYYHVSGAPTLQTEATLVIPKFWDNGTDIAALTNNKYASHTLLRSPKEDDSFFLIYSSAEYASQAEAEAAPIDYAIFVNQATSGLLHVARFILKGDSTSIVQIVDERPLLTGAQSAVIGTATMQQVYDNSTNPELVTDTTRGALTIKRGSAADTDCIFEGQNGAGVQTFCVDGNGDTEVTSLISETIRYNSDVTVSSSVVDWTAGSNQISIPTTPTGYAFIDPVEPTRLTLKLDNGAAYAPSWPTNLLWENDTEPTWTAYTDVIRLDFDGTYYSGTAILGVQVSRSVRTGDGSTTYAEPLDPPTLEIGDTAQISFVCPVGGSDMCLLGGASEFVKFDSADLLQLISCTATIDGSAVADGASISAYQDGKVHYLMPTATAQITITHIWQSGIDTNFYAGELFDLYATISGVTTYYPLDNDSTIYQQARGNGLGGEEVANGEFTGTGNVSNWTLDGTATNNNGINHLDVTTGGASNIAATQTIVLASGEPYLLSFERLSGTANCSVYADGVGLGVSATPGNAYMMFVADSSTDIQIRTGGASQTVLIDNISVKHAPKAMEFFNFAAADIFTVTLDRLNNWWTGDDKVTNGGFSADTDWIKGAGWTIGSGVATKTAGTASSIKQDLSAYYTQGDRVLTEYEQTSVTSGNTGAMAGGTSTLDNATVAIFTEVITVGATGADYGIDADATYAGSVDDISIRRVLELP